MPIIGGYISPAGTSSTVYASGGVNSGLAIIISGMVASGSLYGNNFISGAIITYARNTTDDSLTAGQAISGNIAVAYGSGAGTLVPAERSSGLRLPAIGVSITNAASGGSITYVRQGLILQAASGCIPSGFFGTYAYVGSGGLLVNLSGFNAGGLGPNPSVAGASGNLIQRMGIVLSGPALYVNPEPTPSSGLLSGLLAGY